MLLGSLTAAVLGGVVGLVAYSLLHRRGGRLFQGRVRRLAVVGAVFVLVVGYGARLTVAVAQVPSCDSTTNTVVMTAAEPAPTPITTIEKVATAAPTGLAMVLAEAAGGNLCRSADTGAYMATRSDGFVPATGSGVMVGEVFLSWNQPQYEYGAVASHENRHTLQWTVATAVGGPLAFPVAYSVVNFFFPGGRNVFERDAGLASGNYDPNTPLAPIIGPPQILALALVAAAIVLLLLRRLHPRLFRSAIRCA